MALSARKLSLAGVLSASLQCSAAGTTDYRNYGLRHGELGQIIQNVELGVGWLEGKQAHLLALPSIKIKFKMNSSSPSMTKKVLEECGNKVGEDFNQGMASPTSRQGGEKTKLTPREVRAGGSRRSR